MKSLSRILPASPCRPQRTQTMMELSWVADISLTLVCRFSLCCVSLTHLQRGRVFGEHLFHNLYNYSDLAVFKGQLMEKKRVNTIGHCCQGDARRACLKSLLIMSCLTWAASLLISARVLTALVPHVFAVVTSVFLTFFTLQVWMIGFHTSVLGFSQKEMVKKLNFVWHRPDGPFKHHHLWSPYSGTRSYVLTDACCYTHSK